MCHRDDFPTCSWFFFCDIFLWIWNIEIKATFKLILISYDCESDCNFMKNIHVDSGQK